ncbi:FAD-dependent oxidoreductase [Jiella sp. MQZ9-1]|uniref:FAD-dependent oxidoreductase n=1 Tax=Jiella flava TaxID=2816857 RepID=A0A939FXM6_9HYPH|nr:FAD-dependent oxidoreductase [Jiella flava]MBO0662096.1 FAD-dependent oxidoreductase [Jiella flava]MCD2470576.1 FAD-dependent oxidoreductase [Jiella flava]
MRRTLTPDLCVIGGGSGGLTTAAAAAAFGVDVVLVEAGKMGGDCLNDGCVPSKALLAAGKHAAAIRESAQFGITAGEPQIDFAAVKDHVAGVIAAIAPNDSVERFEKLGVTVVEAHASFIDADTVAAGGTIIKARRFVIAAGSSPRVPQIPGLAETPFFTNETIFDLRGRPDHLIIIGGGPIGIEMAQAHRRLGCAVTVLEAGAFLGRDDPQLVAVVLAKLRAEGVALREGAKVVAVSTGQAGLTLTIETASGRETVPGSHLLVAVGRRPNVGGLGLDAAGIDFDAAGITVGADLRTTNRRVYAVGDVAGGPQFTHVASYQAGLVLRPILFRLPLKERRDHLPRVTFTDPELGQVGATEAEARAAGTLKDVLIWPYAENDRAQAERRLEGLVKIVVGRKGRIIGAGVAGVSAGEITNLMSLVVAKRMTVADLRDFISPYPTLSEIGKRAATDYYRPYTQKPWVRAAVRLLARFG